MIAFRRIFHTVLQTTTLLLTLANAPALQATATTDLTARSAAALVKIKSLLTVDPDLKYYPVVIIGAGLHESIFVANVGKSTITIEASSMISSTLSMVGDAVVMNSTSRQNPNLPSIPGGGDLNKFPGLPFQVAQFTPLRYPLLGDWIKTALLNRAEIAGTHPILFNYSVIEVIKEGPGNSAQGKYRVIVENGGQNKVYDNKLEIRTDAIVDMRGLGRPSIPAGLKPAVERERAQGNGTKVLFATEVLGNAALLRKLSEQRATIAVIGAADTGRVTVEWLSRSNIIPASAYGEANPLTSGEIEKIVWVGQSAKTCEEFLAKNRARYSDISISYKTGLIDPAPGKLQQFARTERGKYSLMVGTAPEKTRQYTVDYIVLATGFINNDPTFFVPGSLSSIKLESGMYGLGVTDSSYYFAGAKLVTFPFPKVFETLAALNKWNMFGVAENRASFWLLAPLTQALAKYIGRGERVAEDTSKDSNAEDGRSPTEKKIPLPVDELAAAQREMQSFFARVSGPVRELRPFVQAKIDLYVRALLTLTIEDRLGTLRRIAQELQENGSFRPKQFAYAAFLSFYGLNFQIGYGFAEYLGLNWANSSNSAYKKESELIIRRLAVGSQLRLAGESALITGANSFSTLTGSRYLPTQGWSGATESALKAAQGICIDCLASDNFSIDDKDYSIKRATAYYAIAEVFMLEWMQKNGSVFFRQSVLDLYRKVENGLFRSGNPLALLLEALRANDELKGNVFNEAMIYYLDQVEKIPQQQQVGKLKSKL